MSKSLLELLEYTTYQLEEIVETINILSNAFETEKISQQAISSVLTIC